MISLSSQTFSQKWFTIIELIIGMAIFSIGMTGILALLHTTIENSLYSRHEIVASDILREQIELVKNARNSNVRNFVPFDRFRSNSSTSSSFASGNYIIENDFTATGAEYNSANGDITHSPIFMSGITLNTADLVATFTQTQLYLDDKWRYVHQSSPASYSTGTSYASYMIISPLWYKDTSGNFVSVNDPKTGSGQGYILDARVLVKGNGSYKEYDLKTVITDWKR